MGINDIVPEDRVGFIAFTVAGAVFDKGYNYIETASGKLPGAVRVAYSGIKITIDTLVSYGIVNSIDNDWGNETETGELVVTLVAGSVGSFFGGPLGSAAAALVADGSYDLYKDLRDLEDPDGGYNGANLVARDYGGGGLVPKDQSGYGPAIVGGGIRPYDGYG